MNPDNLFPFSLVAIKISIPPNKKIAKFFLDKSCLVVRIYVLSRLNRIDSPYWILICKMSHRDLILYRLYRKLYFGRSVCKFYMHAFSDFSYDMILCYSYHGSFFLRDLASLSSGCFYITSRLKLITTTFCHYKQRQN